mmetsp:Transcript_54319/g.96557  ORF Transcript_54319/g.96557 Transcript_54319/m.96557 type:complete len:200 (-) Transcript_54319:262-861(-)
MTTERLGAATTRVVQHVEAVAQRLSLCRQAFREGLAEASALNDAQTALYQMDVGGALFHTCTEVLHPQGGMLSAMASGDFTHDEEDGSVFLDRDPTYFPLVLHFVRTGVALLPEDAEGRAALLREAQYYSLEGLCWAARPLLQERLIIMRSHRWGTYCEMYNPLQESWEPLGEDMGDLFCAGDGCLFAVWFPDDTDCPP